MARAVAAAAQPLTLVDTPVHSQHHPYLVWKLFTNRSIVMHGFKGADLYRRVPMHPALLEVEPPALSATEPAGP